MMNIFATLKCQKIFMISKSKYARLFFLYQTHLYGSSSICINCDILSTDFSQSPIFELFGLKNSFTELYSVSRIEIIKSKYNFQN